MIWATWRMHRSVFISSIVVAVALAIWLAITGAMEANSWAIFTSHHCSPDYPGSSLVCMNSLSGVGNFSTVNAALCGALPALLGMVLGVPLVASEIQQRTNRLAWTQSITRTRWLLVKIGVGTLFTAVIVGSVGTAGLVVDGCGTAQSHPAGELRRGSRLQAGTNLIAGLIPQAVGVTDTDMDRGLKERAEALQRRAHELAERAIDQNPLWLRQLGARPSDPLAAERWLEAVKTIAAYRERWSIDDDPRPLGSKATARSIEALNQRRLAQAAFNTAMRVTHATNAAP